MSMSVDEIRNVILLFSNPSWTGADTVSTTVIKNITAQSMNMTYSARFSGNTTVLSTKVPVSVANGGIIQGLLHVPDLGLDDACVDLASDYVPEAAVRRSDLPPTNYHLVALAPWVSAHCARAYLLSARAGPVRALVFYLAGNNTMDPPPPADSPVWHIESEPDWRSQINFPIYAIPGPAGQQMMHYMTMYSGNLSEVPFGHNISLRFNGDPEDYVRIWTELVIAPPAGVLPIWVYFLVVLGVLLGVILGTSLIMHLLQARRRWSLRRRVVAGEVNLEGLGIRRLVVPIAHVETFPLFTYHYQPEDDKSPMSPRSPSSRTRRNSDMAITKHPSTVVVSSEKGPNGPLSPSSVATGYQPACEICLEPYQNRVTIIRELPCGHIFHPDCIDEFLHERSSLCPLCKSCMLPKGYCPKITNDMVRRERAIRRLRDRVAIRDVENWPEGGKWRGWNVFIRSRLFIAREKTSPACPPSPTDLQVRKTTTLEPRVPLQVRTSRRDREASGRGSPTSLARERMRELAGSEMGDSDRQTGTWRRIRRRVFPLLG